MIKIGFITGARSEYGIMKRVIKELRTDPLFDVKIVATGMHYQQKYGDTINEIRKDGLAPVIDAPCYVEEERAKEKKIRERERRAQEAVLAIKKKYGKNAILKGMNLEEGAQTIARNSQIGGHKA
jgi:hypothetical protein